MNASTQRWLSFITLMAWGGILLYFHLSGRIVAFLHPFFRPLVLISGIGLLALAIGYWWASRTEKKGQPCCGHEHEATHHAHSEEDGCCGHAHAEDSSFGRIAAFLILLAPMLTAAAFSPDEFGSGAILNRGVIMDPALLRGDFPAREQGQDWLPLPGEITEGGQDPSIADYLPRSAAGNIQAEVIDLIFGAEDSIIRSDFEGKTVEVIGQVLPATENNPGGKRQKLVRMFMVCCAADARPVAVLVDNVTDFHPEMTWIKVTGTATFPMEGGRRLVVVQARKMEKTTPPEERVLY